jgi:hypothetical protein
LAADSAAKDSRSLSSAQRQAIYAKLGELPKTRDQLFRLLYPQSGDSVFSPSLKKELEGLLKLSLLETDTQVRDLTPEVRRELRLANEVAAFHKQVRLPFEILPSSGSSLLNEDIRKLENPGLFKHAHHAFVTDREVSQDANSVILLLHELSHTAFDRWVEKHPQAVETYLRRQLPAEQVTKLFSRDWRGRIRIDADVYDLLSERYAFELEFRINWEAYQKLGKKAWPFFYRYFDMPVGRFRTEIDDFVRRNYGINRPELKNFETEPTEKIMHAYWQAELLGTEWFPPVSAEPASQADCESLFSRIFGAFK